MQGSNKEILCQLSMLERRMAQGKKIFGFSLFFPLFLLINVMLMKMILRRASSYVNDIGSLCNLSRKKKDIGSLCTLGALLVFPFIIHTLFLPI